MDILWRDLLDWKGVIGQKMMLRMTDSNFLKLRKQISSSLKSSESYESNGIAYSSKRLRLGMDRPIQPRDNLDRSIELCSER